MLSILTLLSLLVAACNGADRGATSTDHPAPTTIASTTTTGAPAPVTTLAPQASNEGHPGLADLDGKWELIAATYRDDQVDLGAIESVSLMNLHTDRGRFAAWGACNSFQGNFAYAEGTLSMTDVAGTLVRCTTEAQQSLERTLSEIMVRPFSVQSNGHEMVWAGNGIVLVYARAQPRSDS